MLPSIATGSACPQAHLLQQHQLCAATLHAKRQLGGSLLLAVPSWLDHTMFTGVGRFAVCNSVCQRSVKRLWLPEDTVEPREVTFRLHSAKVPNKTTVNGLSRPLSGGQLETLTARVAVRTAGPCFVCILNAGCGAKRRELDAGYVVQASSWLQLNSSAWSAAAGQQERHPEGAPQHI